MRKIRWDIIVLSTMFLCAAFISGGCGREDREEAVLAGIEEADIREADAEESAGEKAADGAPEESGGGAVLETAGTIYVDVCGEVVSPGVYELPADSRVYQAVEKAGGMTQKAAAAGINQAERLSDGQQIYVPSGEEAKNQAAGQTDAGASSGDGKVNLNTASKEDLMTLTGIGEVKAESIIKYREDKGSFHSIEDIKEIEGIKDGVFNKIKDQIKI